MVSKERERVEGRVRTDLVQAESNVVSVESESMELEVEEVLLEGGGDSGLKGRRGQLQARARERGCASFTFPLALKPVSQMVAPVCPRS